MFFYYLNMKALLTILTFTITQINTMFFDLQSGLERCYVDELFTDTTILIKYKVFTFESEGENYIKNNIDAVWVNIYDDYGRRLTGHKVTNYKNKFTLHIKEDSFYRICVETSGGSYEARGKVFFQLKLASENMDEPDISKAIKKEDVSNLQEDLRALVRKSSRIVRYQKGELNTEDSIAKLQISDSRLYYGLTVIQIVIIGLVFCYNLYIFIKLINKN
jgi:hypothetical protein